MIIINFYSCLKENLNKDISLYQNEIRLLNQELIKNKIPKNWLLENINNSKFQIYDNIESLFKNMAENKVSRKEKDFNWYKNYMGLDIRIKNADKFILKHISLLEQAEKKHGIHYELIVAIFGIETNYANNKGLGNFYIFPALFSQYIFIPSRKKWAIRELINLYKFSKKLNKDVYYFIGSFAGASGWAQFIPTSHLKYFIDSKNNNSEIDIYEVEDNIMSIENYLYHHGLNKSNIDLFKIRYNTIFKYNPNQAYAQAVLYIYDALRGKRADL